MSTATATQLVIGQHTFDALVAGPADGELVLLLHGFPEFADCWTEQLDALAAAGYRALAVDQRGYSPGARPETVEEYAVEKLVADALGFADALGAERFHLVAHDWGGLVAWALAWAHPERLRSLTVLATPHPEALYRALTGDGDQRERSQYVRHFRLPGHVAELGLLADDAATLRALYRGALSPELIESNVKRLTEPGALTGGINWYRALNEELRVPAGEITVPTLFVWGTEDRALGREAAELTADHVKAPYRFVALEGATHWLPEADAERIMPLLLEHLAG
ncbi:pimeloyl-ACP methyl ester carboxylesterase [Kitasatospora sp. GAS204A]|uniref:alpha/beta fold hydrolase n=1 Tax=unclassified Kitasatospora TaxID=2633591 RepID=UPI002473F68A|nr:alpha/beta hydrolase [Kitasatospora sp. GAS204B]MDH6116801.1 pimeloyl-ACP methyl ester carboxylesterase [Kitasatospora sp. GAS204B]